ncbi:hypothetical protein CRG98_045764, partial [Punica granatum]
MAGGGKSKKANNTGADSMGKRRKQYLPHNKPVKKKGYPLRPGVQGFFITCDGGRERQAAREAINVVDSFYEELVHGDDAERKSAELSAQPANKKIKFTYSESSSGEDDEEDSSEQEDGDEEDGEEGKEEESKSGACPEKDADSESLKNEATDAQKKDEAKGREQAEEAAADVDKNGKVSEDRSNEAGEPPAKKQCLEKDSSKAAVADRKEEKSVDKLIEAELEELADKNK